MRCVGLEKYFAVTAKLFFKLGLSVKYDLYNILFFSKLNFFSYEMMTDCWKESPEARSTFTQIRERLETMMQKDNPYLDLTAVDETCAYYNVPSFNSVTEESTSDGSSDINSLEPDEDDKKEEDSDDYKQSTLEGDCAQRLQRSFFTLYVSRAATVALEFRVTQN